MEIDIDQTRWYDRLWAALVYFTRLPFWRLHEPPKECYKTVVEHWPLTGWVTGGAMAATLWVGSLYLPYVVAVVAAIVVRLLVTGALHEDGLADFLDGFGGGGRDRQRILDIMKDSHIGTYGVLGLVAYALLLVGALSSLPLQVAMLAILAADPFSKMVTAQLLMMMPYARTAEEAKSKTVYRKMSAKAGVSLAVQGLSPMVAVLWIFVHGVSIPNGYYPPILSNWEAVIFAPCIVMYFLYLMIWRRLHGYTGDCCGAVCLLVELAVYLSLLTVVT